MQFSSKGAPASTGETDPDQTAHAQSDQGLHFSLIPSILQVVQTLRQCELVLAFTARQYM